MLRYGKPKKTERKCPSKIRFAKQMSLRRRKSGSDWLKRICVFHLMLFFRSFIYSKDRGHKVCVIYNCLSSFKNHFVLFIFIYKLHYFYHEIFSFLSPFWWVVRFLLHFYSLKIHFKKNFLMYPFFPVYSNELGIFDHPMIDFELQRSKLISISFHDKKTLIQEKFNLLTVFTPKKSKSI